ncbi:MAG: diaminopimelate decarboxylase [Bacteroidales bacterium]|jgi:diaminopimelate decarboxylase|nr:diaminopimelate decarboxylase [Bacteroidales bacterium]MCI2121610.1 diaminopimelate decarboxylase [Bacteroidales bacterium]MCI2144711.1 diaminopimelate decarboxylase [Bacteroidales bacterium]
MITKEALECFQRFRSPFYYYDMELLDKTLSEYNTQLSQYGWMAHYAVKANCDSPILRLICKAGLGADCVSGNEIKAAMKEGFDPRKIVFAGVGKTDAEIRFALEAGILCFNCESLQELSVIDSIASRLGKKARVALRINPNIDAHTNNYISTGRCIDKFGFTEKMLPRFFELFPKLTNCEFVGLHFHIGSQITDMQAFRLLCEKACAEVRIFGERGFKVTDLNLGGGLGVDYDNPEAHGIPNFTKYFETIRSSLSLPEGVRVHLEPGRSIVAQSGYLVTRVLFIKDNGERKFVIVDAGMNNLIRPALYRAKHRIMNLSSYRDCQTYDVVGPVCETSDKFATDAVLPECGRGDLLAICSAGAYGEVMEMKYNRRDFAKAYYSDRLNEYKSNIDE